MQVLKPTKISQKEIFRAVSVSSKIEGLSLTRARKNTKAIKLLQKHGRAFSL
jgi:hypothetical protein